MKEKCILTYNISSIFQLQHNCYICTIENALYKPIIHSQFVGLLADWAAPKTPLLNRHIFPYTFVYSATRCHVE